MFRAKHTRETGLSAFEKTSHKHDLDQRERFLKHRYPASFNMGCTYRGTLGRLIPRSNPPRWLCPTLAINGYGRLQIGTPEPREACNCLLIVVCTSSNTHKRVNPSVLLFLRPSGIRAHVMIAGCLWCLLHHVL